MIDWSKIRRIHLIGVAGTGMGSFAGMLKAAGYEVTGSDENVYPPMSTQLERWGIEVMTPYAAANLDRARPDLVVVGNVVRAVNPEATAMRERGLPHVSFPAALGEAFIAPRHAVVVVGTHGKTTTSAMMGALLHHAGRDPSFLVGGVTRDFDSNYRLGSGPHFVVEGDEYDTAYFDKGPKFLHYRPRTAILTSCELDHADIYRDEAHYESAFEKFVELLPGGRVPRRLRELRERAPHRATARRRGWRPTRSPTPAPTGRPAACALAPDGARFTLVRKGRALADVHLPVGGAHNVENALGVAAAAAALGLSPAEIAAGLAAFHGVRRRQEVRGTAGGVVVVDDFAHHPRAVAQTLAAIQGTFPGARLLAAFEPRSNTSRRNLHQDLYASPSTWGTAAEVFLVRPAPTDQVPEGERLDLDAVTGALSAAGKPARAFATVDELVPAIVAAARPGDVVVAMSNGAFGGIWGKLLEALGR